MKEMIMSSSVYLRICNALVILLILLATVSISTNDIEYLEIRVLFGNSNPASNIEIILSKPVSMFKCGSQPRYILAKSFTNEDGIAGFNLTSSVDRICMFIKYGDTYIDLDRADPYNRGYLLDLEGDNRTYTFVLEIYPPTISTYNLSITVLKHEDRLEIQSLVFWFVVVDNDPENVYVEAKVFTRNRTFSLAIAKKDRLSLNSVNISFYQLIPDMHSTILQELNCNETPYIVLMVRDSEGFSILKKINITWQNIKYMELRDSSIEKELSDIINTISPRLNTTETTSEIMFSPINRTIQTQAIRDNRILLSNPYSIFIPLIGFATIILEYLRRRSTQ